MAKNKPKSLPRFEVLDDLVDFFDSHDLGEYVEHMPESQFDVDLENKTHLVALDSDLSDKLSEIAKSKRVPVETLINTWLRQKLVESVA